MGKYTQDFVKTLMLLSNSDTVLSVIQDQYLLLPSGHINLRACFRVLGLEDKYYWTRLDRHFSRMRVQRKDFSHVRIHREQHLLIPERYAIDIVTHTAKGLIIYGRAVNDLRGRGDSDTTTLLSYKPWKSMFERCYDPNWQHRKPQYKGVEVCEAWHLFSSFNDWYVAHCPPKLIKHRYHSATLNKDVVDKNRIYSPDTCFIIPESLSAFMSGVRKSQSDLPIGVGKAKGKGRYSTKLKIKGQRYSLGVYNSAEEASSVYQTARWLVITKMADKYYRRKLVKIEFVRACRARLSIESTGCPIPTETLIRKINDWEEIIKMFDMFPWG